MEFETQGRIVYDVSFYQAVLLDQNGRRLPVEQQKHVDFNKLKTDGNASAVVIRAGQDFYEDIEFRISWENAAKAGVPRASYWFCDKDRSPQEQARFYWNMLKNDPGEGFIAGDIEGGSWTNPEEWYKFFFELQQISGYPDHKIFFYSNFYFWTQYAQGTSIAWKKWFLKFPLWLAAYTDIKYASYVRVPLYWDTATLWQQGTPSIGRQVGVWSEEIDINYWNGKSIYTFEEVFGISPEPPVVEKPVPYEIRIRNDIYRLGQ